MFNSHPGRWIAILWFCVILGSLDHRFSSNCMAQELGVGAYLPDYRAAYNVNASAPHLTDLILFSIQPHSRGMIGGCCLQPHHYQLGRDGRQHNSNLRVWVTIGGAGRSDALASILADATKSKRLIDGSIRLCKQHELYGIDLDIFSGNFLSVGDEFKLMKFMKEASDAWREEGIKLSVTWHPHRMKLPKPIFKLVDRVNLMAYDMVTKLNMHHSTLASTKQAVQALLDQSCPANKIWLGIPAYARSLTNPQDVMTFESIHKMIKNNNEYDMDTTHQHNEYEWDSPERIRAKVDYALLEKLGGVFFWELGQDYQDETVAPGGILLEAASKQRRHSMLKSSSNEEL